jgi:hypothetical protein
MTGAGVSPLVPPAASSDRLEGSTAVLARRPLPVPRLAVMRLRSTVYGLAAVDDQGRVASHSVVRALAGDPVPGSTSTKVAGWCSYGRTGKACS